MPFAQVYMDDALIKYLLDKSGPILRWLTATQLQPESSPPDREKLLSSMLSSEEVRHWLDLLGRGPVHHSMDASVENVLAKLGEYGLRSGMAGLDARLAPYFAVVEGEAYHDIAVILVPFLVRLGFYREPQLASWIAQRIDLLYDLACRQDYDFFMTEEERLILPPSQHSLHGRP